MIAALYVQFASTLRAKASSSWYPKIPSVRARTAKRSKRMTVPTPKRPQISGRNWLSRAGAMRKGVGKCKSPWATSQ